MLTTRKRKFVQEYVQSGNATQAAKRAGYSPKTARSQGQRLLTDVDIKKMLAEKMEKAELTAALVIASIGEIAQGDIRSLFNTDGSLKPLHELTRAEAAMLASVELADISSKGRGTTRTELRKIKTWNKLQALELLAKHFGLLVERTEVTGPEGGPIVFKWQS